MLQSTVLVLQFFTIIFGPTCFSNVFPLTLPSVEAARYQPLYLPRTVRELPSLGHSTELSVFEPDFPGWLFLSLWRCIRGLFFLTITFLGY